MAKTSSTRTKEAQEPAKKPGDQPAIAASGCHEEQGYHFARPMALPDLIS